MSDTAAASKTGFVTLHAGPVASTEYIVPFTSAQVSPVMAAPVIGLVPRSPVITEGGTSTIAVFARIAKLPADPRSTGEGAVKGAPFTPGITAAVIRQSNAIVKTKENIFPDLFIVLVIVLTLMVTIQSGSMDILSRVLHLLQQRDYKIEGGMIDQISSTSNKKTLLKNLTVGRVFCIAMENRSSATNIFSGSLLPPDECQQCDTNYNEQPGNSPTGLNN